MKNVTVILAAGSSSRLGQPKQLLLFNGKTLLRNAIEAAVALEDNTTLVITGAEHDQLLPEIPTSNVTVLNNPHWQEGMGSSISLAIKYILEESPDCMTFIVTVCDQPYLSSAIFQQLIQELDKTDKGVVASGYADTVGSPVLFTRQYFDDLSKLTGEQGAKSILSKHQQDLSVVQFPKGSVDIDTRQAYNDLLYWQL